MRTISNIFLYLSIAGLAYTALYKIMIGWSWALAGSTLSLMLISILIDVWADKREDNRIKRRSNGYHSKKIN